MENPGGAEEGASLDGAGGDADCIVRRVVIDPGRRLLIDVPGRTVKSLGGEAVEAGLAGAGFAMDMGRKLVGSEVPEPPADETARP